MTDVTEHHLHHQPIIYDLAQRKKQILDSLSSELVADVALLNNQIGDLSPQATLLFNSSVHPDVKQQVAQAALALMRICAALDMDFTEAIESRILQQESELFRQQDLEL